MCIRDRSYAKKMEVLLLGAWGCGVFRNDPNLIAKLFKEQLECRCV